MREYFCFSHLLCDCWDRVRVLKAWIISNYGKQSTNTSTERFVIENIFPFKPNLVLNHILKLHLANNTNDIYLRKEISSLSIWGSNCFISFIYYITPLFFIQIFIKRKELKVKKNDWFKCTIVLWFIIFVIFLTFTSLINYFVNYLCWI